MTKKNYLITGGFGLIGSTLANNLNGSITIISRSDEHRGRVTRNDVKVQLKKIEEIAPKDLEGINIVYHCASTVDNYNILTDPYIDVKTNIEGTIHLLEQCKNLRKKPKIIYLSTFFVYGNTYDETNVPINEESKTDPLAIYPATKLCTESVIKLYSKLYDIPYLICRLTNVYGETEDFDNKKKGALNYLIMKAVKGEPLNVYKGGNFVRDYIYVDDVAACLQFIENKLVNDTLLIGYGHSVEFRQIIKILLKYTKNKSQIIEIDPPDFHKIVGINNFVADTAKLNNLGWHAKIDINEGLHKIVNTYTKLINKNLQPTVEML